MTGCGSLKACSQGQTRQLFDSQADLSPNTQCWPSAACELDDVKLGHRGAWKGSRDRHCRDHATSPRGLASTERPFAQRRLSTPADPGSCFPDDLVSVLQTGTWVLSHCITNCLKFSGLKQYTCYLIVLMDQASGHGLALLSASDLS